jgi:hypothetical protein
VISGMISRAQNSSFTVAVTDSDARQGQASLTISVSGHCCLSPIPGEHAATPRANE